ncbi:1-Phosphofructokinase [Arthrobacter sp. Hiyo8]|nr:1-Phosphofructokinase [Arthrobacter sp. Hiyo8]
MIVTLTANPSLDRTVELPAPLARGEVQRAVAVHQHSGGKGVNVSRALVASAWTPLLSCRAGIPILSSPDCSTTASPTRRFPSARRCGAM